MLGLQHMLVLAHISPLPESDDCYLNQTTSLPQRPASNVAVRSSTYSNLHYEWSLGAIAVLQDGFAEWSGAGKDHQIGSFTSSPFSVPSFCLLDWHWKSIFPLSPKWSENADKEEAGITSLLLWHWTHHFLQDHVLGSHLHHQLLQREELGCEYPCGHNIRNVWNYKFSIPGRSSYIKEMVWWPLGRATGRIPFPLLSRWLWDNRFSISESDFIICQMRMKMLSSVSCCEWIMQNK